MGPRRRILNWDPSRRRASSAWSATRRPSLPAIAAFVTGGSARARELAQRERRVLETEACRLLQGRCEQRRETRSRAVPALRRAARRPSGSAARGSRDPRSQVDWPRPAGPRRGLAPRARARCAVAPATDRYPSIASQLFAYAAECEARSITRMRTPAAEATLRTNAAPAWSGVRTSRCGDRGPLSDPAPEERSSEVRPSGSTTARRRGREAGRAGALRDRGHPPRRGRRSRAPFRRRASCVRDSRPNAC